MRYDTACVHMYMHIVTRLSLPMIAVAVISQMPKLIVFIFKNFVILLRSELWLECCNFLFIFFGLIHVK